ncbi:diguanylate phosphodiesterase [Marinobacter lutaoensis]|uniref:Diguanylate phosphodiesterase n=1 Tax=Marinobacter lutaoensis TaxID=135739 RepID=A0A1V2DQM5_9GAMM|nr:diguanylate phosphodiesterase [Marinobacter lutaoensis]
MFDESHCDSCACGDGLDFSFSFAFQPIVDVSTASVYAYEALVRGPAGEPASTVLARVDDGNRYAFDQVCRVKAVKLAARLGMSAKLSINFMPNAVYRAEYCIRTTLAAARTYHFDTRQIIFEIVESEELSSVDHLVDIVETYQNMGFLTAIDDFGAGYSRFNLLVARPPDLVKLDMALIRNIDRDPNKQAVVAGMITMMTALGGDIIAEGVETREEYAWLRARGIHLFQGYLFAKPGFESLPEPVIPDQPSI